jgi:hypothetical protein
MNEVVHEQRDGVCIGCADGGVPVEWLLAEARGHSDEVDDLSEVRCVNCGHAEEYHGPEVPGCVECRCRRFRKSVSTNQHSTCIEPVSDVPNTPQSERKTGC